jgi:hypothetical protein
MVLEPSKSRRSNQWQIPAPQTLQFPPLTIQLKQPPQSYQTFPKLFKLEGPNYLGWVAQFQPILRGNDLQGLIEGMIYALLSSSQVKLTPKT